MMQRLALALSVLPLSVFAAEPWDEPFSGTGKEIVEAAKLVSAPKDADADSLLLDMRVTFDEKGRRTQTVRHVYRLNTPTGVEEWNGVSAKWSPWFESRPVIRARVISPTGAEQQLDPATLSEAPADAEQSIYRDARMLQGPLPALAPGYIVEEETVTSEHLPFFDAGVAGRAFAFDNPYVAVSRVRLEAPSSLPLKFEVRAGKAQTRTEKKNGRQIVELSLVRTELGPPPPADQWFAPPDVEHRPHIDYSTGASWQSIAERYHQRVEERLGTVDRKALAKAAIKDARSREEIARRLLAFVHEKTRYTGLQFGEASIIPVSPEETLQRGYGDCKDLSVLMVGLLRAAGVPAHVAVLRTAPGDISDKLPGLGLVDHAIVHVPGARGSKDLWIDPTVTSLPAGELVALLQGRPALIAAPGTRGLTRLPTSSSADNTSVVTREFHLAEWSTGRAIEHRQLTGGMAEPFRGVARRGKDAVAGYLKSFAGGLYSSDKFENVTHSKAEDLHLPFSVRFEVPKAPVVNTGWNDASIAFTRAMPFDWMPEALTDVEEDEDAADGAEDAEQAADGRPRPPRTADYELEFAHRSETVFKIYPPPGFTLTTPLPPAEKSDVGPGRFEARYEAAKDGAVVVTLRFDSVKRRYSVAEAEAFRKAYRELVERPNVELRFEHDAVTLMQANRVKEAVAVYRKRAAERPSSGIAQIRYAGALAELGLGEAARDRAALATEAEPTLAVAWVIRAWIQSRDLFGRDLHEGFDRAGAIASYKKAIELEPERADLRMRLGHLLARDEKAVVFGKGADLAGAVAAYAHAVDVLKHAEAEDALLETLYAAGRHDEVIRRAPKMRESASRNAIWIASVASKGTAQDALDEAQRRIRDGGARRQALLTAAHFLVRKREYPRAVPLLREAVKGTSESSQLALLGLLEKLRPYEQVKLAKDDPRAALVSMVRAATGAPVAAKDVLTDRLASELDKAKVDLAQLSRRSMRSLPPVLFDFAADIAASGPLTVEGDAKVGYRVVADDAMGGERRTLYVKIEKGTARLAAVGTFPGAVAAEAFAAAEANDLPRARRWLDWMHDLLASYNDPLSIEFRRIAPRGHPATREEIMRAAALAMSSSLDAERAASFLEKHEPTWPAEGRLAVALGLGIAYNTLDQPKKAVASFNRALSLEPRSNEVFHSQMRTLRTLRDYEAMERAANARLALIPDDFAAITYLADADIGRKRIDSAIARLKSVVDAQRANPETYNNLAWYSFAAGRTGPEVESWAVKAVSMRKERSAASLNTLAAVLAASGKAAEAMRFLLKSIEQDPEEEQDPATWFVAGLIAEAYGLPDEALRLYAHVDVSQAHEKAQDTVEALTRARLVALGKDPGAPGQQLVKPSPP